MLFAYTAVIILMVTTPNGLTDALDCLECTSTDESSLCASDPWNGAEISACPEGYNRCMTVRLDLNGNLTISRACATPENCSAPNPCWGALGSCSVNRQLYCCNTDVCNDHLTRPITDSAEEIPMTTSPTQTLIGDDLAGTTISATPSGVAVTGGGTCSIFGGVLSFSLPLAVLIITKP
ncbi:uncharacterized protein LOC118413974 isoform X1 [Branchiostoma floridae]|uniref:Uncharacterized protein LOC118413974 isoform X1 n=1 Tax=Branchiostoma floridae TaxID=7739 RepID=A0A9J7L1L9_BRAFL|nr:uncharacterized protein LOC118413974 isoform X1 [Branchiostoma floridae]